MSSRFSAVSSPMRAPNSAVRLDIRGGVQVVGIKADGILARARVKQGFVITHINDRPVYSVADMQRMDEKVRSIDGIYPNGRAASYTLVE